MGENEKILVDVDCFEIIDIQPTEMIVFKFDPEQIKLDKVYEIHKKLQNKYPYNSIMIIPNECTIETWSKRNVIGYMKNMFDFLYNVEDDIEDECDVENSVDDE